MVRVNDNLEILLKSSFNEVSAGPACVLRTIFARVLGFNFRRILIGQKGIQGNSCDVESDNEAVGTSETSATRKKPSLQRKEAITPTSGGIKAVSDDDDTNTWVRMHVASCRAYKV